MQLGRKGATELGYITYRDLGPGRTIAAAWRAAGGAGRVSGRWYRIARKKRWKERAADWDQKVEAAALAGVTESAADSPRRDWSRITEQLLTQASKILDTEGPLAPVMVLSLSRIIASGIALERMIHDSGPTAGGVAPWHLWAQELRSVNRDRMLAQDRLDWPDDDEEVEH